MAENHCYYSSHTCMILRHHWTLLVHAKAVTSIHVFVVSGSLWSTQLTEDDIKHPAMWSEDVTRRYVTPL